MTESETPNFTDKTDSVLACQHLQKIYDQGPQQITVLKDINLDIKRGERIAIIGSSGSGKSTLLNLLGGLDIPSAGEVWVAGKQLSQLDDNARGLLRNRHLGFVDAQEFILHLVSTEADCGNDGGQLWLFGCVFWPLHFRHRIVWPIWLSPPL